MLHPAKKLEKAEVRGTDGVLGHVADLLFDDRFWHLRYFIVDTGVWLSGRRVLLSPLAFAAGNNDPGCLAAQLSQAQVRGSPSIDDTVPLTREHESKLHEYYQWRPYWASAVPLSGDVLPDPVTTSMTDAPPATNLARETEARQQREHPAVTALNNDPHLRSARHVRNHRIAATDGEIGHVDDFLVDPRTWQIRYLVVDTRNWWPGRRVLIAPLWLNRLSWNEAKVFADLSRDAIKSSPEYRPDQPVLRDYADQLHRHYQREPHTW